MANSTTNSSIAEPTATRRVVTVSATYGAGGSVIAPRLAQRLACHSSID